MDFSKPDPSTAEPSIATAQASTCGGKSRKGKKVKPSEEAGDDAAEGAAVHDTEEEEE